MDERRAQLLINNYKLFIQRAVNAENNSPYYEDCIKNAADARTEYMKETGQCIPSLFEETSFE